MGKFKSINYSRVVCEGCGKDTTIEPGTEFKGLNCSCGQVPDPKLDIEISTPVQEELDYSKSQTVTVIGMFKNGDYEVINSNDATDSWRVPKDTFESTYFEVLVDNSGFDPEADKINNAFNRLQELEAVNRNEDEQLEYKELVTYLEAKVYPEAKEVTLSLEDLKGKTLQEVKDTYNMNELSVLATACGIKRVSRMKEDTLIGKLLEKA